MPGAGPLRTRASTVSGSFLCRVTARARRRVQDAKCLATCSKAPLILLLSNSTGGAHVMPAFTSCCRRCCRRYAVVYPQRTHTPPLPLLRHRRQAEQHRRHHSEAISTSLRPASMDARNRRQAPRLDRVAFSPAPSATSRGHPAATVAYTHPSPCPHTTCRVAVQPSPGCT